MSQPASAVRGSPEFYKLYRKLSPSSLEKRLIDSAIDRLKSNLATGVKVQKTLWPAYYVRKHGVNNLWKLDMSGEARLVYTVLNEREMWVVVVLEAFLGHKEYEKRFGYK